MRFVRNLIIAVLLLALLTISIVGIMIEMPGAFGRTPDRIHELGRSFLAVMRPGNLLFWSWIALAVGCLLVFLMAVVRPRKQMKLEVQMGGGRVVILDSAIKRYIRSALAELPGVTVRRMDLRETRLGVATDIYADVKAQGNLPVLQREMIQRVRSALAEDLGITSIGDVHVFIRDFEVAERAPAQTAVRRPHSREPKPDETEPEPAHQTAEVTRSSIPSKEPERPVQAAEFTRPTGSTGPFDQVPAPAGLIAAAAHAPKSEGYSARIATTSEPANNPSPFTPYQPTATEGTAEAGEKDTYFTPSPTAGTAAKVTDLGPKEIFTLGEAAGDTSFKDTETSSIPSSSTPAEAAEVVAAPERPRKRGLFGLFGGAPQPDSSAIVPAEVSDVSASDSPAAAEYDPQTATESVPAPDADEPVTTESVTAEATAPDTSDSTHGDSSNDRDSSNT